MVCRNKVKFRKEIMIKVFELILFGLISESFRPYYFVLH